MHKNCDDQSRASYLSPQLKYMVVHVIAFIVIDLHRKLFTGNFELPPAAAVIQGVDQLSSGQIVIEKNDQGETRARGFDLQPVIVTDDRSAADHSDSVAMETRQGKLSSFVSDENDERGFGLRPVGSLPVDLSVESSVDETDRRLASSRLESRGIDLTPSVATHNEGRGFDLQPADDSAGFTLQPATEARGLDLKPAVAASTSGFTEGRGFDLQPAEQRHGFSLQPVVNLLHADQEGTEAVDDEDDDTPPPESLQSIKSIARARKSAGRESVRKSTEASVTTKKTSKSSREKPVKKTTTKPQQKKEKGKVSNSSVDRSNLFKPSPSSGPSWSPTPTMRESKAKVCYWPRVKSTVNATGGVVGSLYNTETTGSGFKPWLQFSCCSISKTLFV